MPVLDSTRFFKIAPNVTSFLGLWVQFGSPPNLEVLGCYTFLIERAKVTVFNGHP